MRTSRALAAASIVTLALPLIASADFPDVGADSTYSAEIGALAELNVIKGYPDGKFYPDKNLNRAEFLTLLYRATGRTTEPAEETCFPDVTAGSWFQDVVCDAVTQRFVSGYNDGTFHPADPVTRAQSLKMLINVFGLPAAELSETDRAEVKFVDVSIAAYYTKFLRSAFKLGILPIAGQEGPRFEPDKPLTRGEAAAYIYNAYHVKAKAGDSSSSGDDGTGTGMGTGTSGGAGTSAQSSSRSRVNPVNDEDVYMHKGVTFPFSDSGNFSGRRSISYLFALTGAKTVISIKASAQDVTGQITCRLYLLGAEGFASEYYLGHQQGKDCTLLTALRPGNYQLQIQGTVSDMRYTVSASAAIGDGNDGFIEAVQLGKGVAKTGVLEPGDVADWYKFTVSASLTGRVEMSGTGLNSCVIYLPADFDQFGFSGPQCGVDFQYIGGTYIFMVGRRGDLQTRQTYTVTWR